MCCVRVEVFSFSRVKVSLAGCMVSFAVASHLDVAGISKRALFGPLHELEGGRSLFVEGLIVHTPHQHRAGVSVFNV
jgi:hypothetical protein